MSQGELTFVMRKPAYSVWITCMAVLFGVAGFVGCGGREPSITHVPFTLGESQSEALALLRQANLRPNVERYRDDDCDGATSPTQQIVTYQSPAAGSKIARRSNVTLKLCEQAVGEEGVLPAGTDPRFNEFPDSRKFDAVNYCADQWSEPDEADELRICVERTLG